MPPRLRFAVALNLLLPGSGLILARRPWLGFTLAMLFTGCAQVTLWGAWIAPEMVSTPLLAVAAGAAALWWIAAQGLLLRQLRRIPSPTDRLSQLATCFALADQAVVEGRFAEARGALDVALTVDDENPETYAKLARLTARVGRYGEARRAWRSVADLDREGRYHREMVQALERLPYRASE